MALEILPEVDWTVVVDRATLEKTATPAADQQVTVVAANDILRTVYGKARIGAQIANVAPYDGSRWAIQAIWVDGPINAIENVSFGNAALPGGVTVTHYLGDVGQGVDPVMAVAIPGYGDTLPGIAYSVFLVPGTSISGFPQIAATIKGYSVYDPRTTLTAWSANPALCVADFLTRAMGKTLDWSSVTTCANECDTLVAGIKRRTLGLCLDSAQDCTTWLDTLRAYASCWVSMEGASVRLVADRPRATDATLTHAAGQIKSLQLKKRGIRNVPTVVRIKYTNITALPWRDDWVEADSGATPRRVSEVSLPGIFSAAQAYREAVERLNKLWLSDLSGDVEAFDEALQFQAGDVLSITHPFGLTNKLMRVMGASGDYGRYRLGLSEYDPAAYSDAVITEPTYPDTALPNPLLPAAAPSGLAAVEEVYTAGDGSVASRLRISWTAAGDPWPIRYAIKIIRQTNAGGAGAAQVASGFSDDPLYVHGPLEDGYYYRVDVCVERTTYGIQGTFASVVVLALGKLLPPSDVTGAGAVITPGGAVLSWSPVIDIDMAGYRVREGSTLLQTVSVTQVNMGLVAPGAHTFLINAYDRSGNESAAAASVLLNVPALTAPSALAASFAGNAMTLNWAAGTSPWPTAYYAIRRGGTDWASATPVATVNSTIFSRVVDWLNNQIWRVALIDIAGNVSPVDSLTVNVVAPAAVVPSSSLNGDQAVITWPTPAGSLAIKQYIVRAGASWDLGAEIARVANNQYSCAVDWASSNTFWVAALDVADVMGPTTGGVVVAVSAPAATSPNVQFIDNDVQISWSVVSSSLPIKHYEVRQGASWAAGVLVGLVQGTTMRQPVAWASRQFWVAAIDTAGNAGSAGSATATVAAYGAVNTLGLTVNNTNLVLTWLPPVAGSLNLECFELRVGGVFASAEVLGTTQASAFSLPIRWATSQTLWVVPKDVRGTYGTAASVALTFSLAAAPSVAKTLIGTKVELSWSIPPATLPITEYAVRYGANWAAGAATEIRIATTNTRLPINWAPGSRTYFVAAVDANGNVGTPSTGAVVNLVAPSAPIINNTDSQLGGLLLDQFRLAWSPATLNSAQLPIDYYIVGYGATTLAKTYSTQYIAQADWLGDRAFWVQAVDLNGNTGSVANKTLTVGAPTAPAITAQVVDNNVLLYWAGSSGSLPVATYELRKGTTWATATLIGQKSGGFTTVLETASGTYTYWVAAVDSAGNVGTPASRAVAVAQPPDYKLNVTWESVFGGTLSNMAIDIDGSRVMGVNASETFQAHFTSHAWTSPQDQISAGYPFYAQPSLLPAYYEETFDYGTLLAATKVTVTTSGAGLSGSPVLSCTISVSANGSTWTDYVGMWSVYGTSFRYVKVRITCTGGQYDLSQLTVVLDSKIRNDAGRLACVAGDAGGTLVTFNVPFVDVEAITVTPSATAPVTVVYDFVDAPNPTSFKVLLFNPAGTRVSGTVSWQARGY